MDKKNLVFGIFIQKSKTANMPSLDLENKLFFLYECLYITPVSRLRGLNNEI